MNLGITAQESIHLRDKLTHSYDSAKAAYHYTTIKSSANLTKKVFGFLPYWELNDNTTNIRLDLLSHIAIFDFLLTSDGSLLPPPGWPSSWLDIINQAHENNVKIILTVSNLPSSGVDPELVSNLINNSSARQTFFEEVKAQIESYNLDGINLDFEAINIEERGTPINNFTQELRDSLNTWFTEKELSFATPAVNWGSYWNLEQLAEICDYLFIMAYDYHGSWSTNAGPVAPLSGNDRYNKWNYQTTIEVDYAGIDPSKLILGVPYYGAEWRIPVGDPYAEVIPDGETNSNWVNHLDYEDAYFIFNDTPSISFDGISQTTYRLAQVGDEYSLVWIDTPPSLELKYDFAIEKNLAGIGIWSLGKDGARNELWSLIEEKFTDTTLSVDDEVIQNEFVLYQNFPNPFNPTTTITFTVPNVERSGALPYNTKLTVYDLLGREVATLVDQDLQPGNHKVTFNASNLSSGVYFYKLSFTDKTAIKKFILMK